MGFSTKKVEGTTSDGHYFTIGKDFTYEAADGTCYVVPAGVVTDGCSSPRLLWQFVSPFGYPWQAAVFHDALYQGAVLPMEPKAKCDSLFHEAMLVTGVDRATAMILYLAVHWFGWRDFTLDRRR